MPLDEARSGDDDPLLVMPDIDEEQFEADINEHGPLGVRQQVLSVVHRSGWILPHLRAPRGRGVRVCMPSEVSGAVMDNGGIPQDVRTPRGDSDITVVKAHAGQRSSMGATARATAALCLVIVLGVAVVKGRSAFGNSEAETVHAQHGDLQDKVALAVHCWAPCGGRAGLCAWCGRGNACCQHGSEEDPEECKAAKFWSTKHWHTCVGPVIAPEDAPEVTDLAVQVEDPELAHGAIDETLCVLDLSQGIFSLGTAGTAIDAASKVCKDLWDQPWMHRYPNYPAATAALRQSNDRSATCSAATNGIMSSFEWASAFLADAAATCGLGFRIPALCAEDSSLFLGNLQELANAASIMSQMCEKGKGRHMPSIAFNDFRRRRLEEIDVDAAVRRLAADKNASLRVLDDGDGSRRAARKNRRHVTVAGVQMSIAEDFNNRPTELAECVFDSGQAGGFLARASLMISRAVARCNEDKHDALGCSIDIESLLDSFQFVGAYISYAVAHCPVIRNTKALCAASVIDVLASIDGMILAGEDFERTCDVIMHGGKNLPATAGALSGVAVGVGSGAADAIFAKNADGTPQAKPPPLHGLPGASAAGGVGIPEQSPKPAPQGGGGPVPGPAPPPAILPERPPPPRSLGPFYMYRIMDAAVTELANLNAGNLPGLMWYLQTLVAPNGVLEANAGTQRLLRFEVEMLAPKALYEKGMNFGVRFAYSNGKCTGPGSGVQPCLKWYNKYGNFVGCNNLGEFPYPTYDVHYPGAVWYSLPGPGLCRGVTLGTDNCTYSVVPAGEIILSDLLNSSGKGARFFANVNSSAANLERVAEAKELFHKRYAYMPVDHRNPPPCDFNYNSFYQD